MSDILFLTGNSIAEIITAVGLVITAVTGLLTVVIGYLNNKKIKGVHDTINGGLTVRLAEAKETGKLQEKSDEHDRQEEKTKK